MKKLTVILMVVAMVIGTATALTAADLTQSQQELFAREKALPDAVLAHIAGKFIPKDFNRLGTVASTIRAIIQPHHPIRREALLRVNALTSTALYASITIPEAGAIIIVNPIYIIPLNSSPF